MLERAARDYEFAESEYQLAKSSFEARCGDQGYEADNDAVCGESGRTTVEYEAALEKLRSAKSDYDHATSELSVSCRNAFERFLLFRR